MCNLYSLTAGQQAIRELARATRDTTGNLPPMPGIFPDYPAPDLESRPMSGMMFERAPSLRPSPN